MMPLSREQVQAMLDSLGVASTKEDVTEVTHRVNALRQALGGLEHPDLDSAEPMSVFPQEEA
jgi:polyhydroxyalkanoate synthesis regulator phasin